MKAVKVQQMSSSKSHNGPHQNTSAPSLSLFSGIGGFEVGMAEIGFSFAATLEWDRKCCETLTLNSHLRHRTYSEIHPSDITKTPAVDFYSGDVDYIVGGPPCQSFSAAGRRAGGVTGIQDGRGRLFESYCSYVKHFSPKAFIFENVRGILSANSGNDFQIICTAFREVGYVLHWRILNAADYGTPQNRERLFLIGIRDDISVDFMFPRPTYGPDSVSKIPWVTAGMAISDLCDEGEDVPAYGRKYGHLLPDIPEGENYRYYTEEMGHPEPVFAWRSKFSGFLYKLDRNDVSRTIVAYQGRYDGPFHWNNRKCTVRELLRLQGFPDDFVIEQSYTEAVKQIGNSVCPPVTTEIGKALRYQIEGHSEFEVPLLTPTEGLTFDARKGQKARITSRKKIRNYTDLKQESLFSPTLAPSNYSKPAKFHALLTGGIGSCEYRDGVFTASINAEGTSLTKSKAAAVVVITFFGTVTRSLKIAKIYLHLDESNEIPLKAAWDEIHTAVRRYTSLNSLLPLYGHFTEPYPKFTIEFSHSVNSSLCKIQDIVLEHFDAKTSHPIALLGNQKKAIELIGSMQYAGFDVRTHETNIAIPSGEFRICYPFTIPADH